MPHAHLALIRKVPYPLILYLGIALSTTDRSFDMKLFLDIGKSQQEIILAIILACSPLGMLLQFGLGLSNATTAGDTTGE